MKRVLLASLLIAVAVMTSGCYEFHQFVHSPFGPGTLCDPTHCCGCSGPCDCGPSDCGPSPCGVSDCGPCRPPFFGSCGFGPTWGCGPSACCEPRCAPGAGCGDCCGLTDACGTGSSQCGPYYDNCCNSGCTCGCCGPGPLVWLGSLFRPGRWFGCYNSGCGEIYWGDFHGDPPDCCDPCDRMGNFTGCSSSGCCNCSGQPGTSFGVPGGGSETREIDPSRAAQPTKAPVVPENKKPNYYSGQQRHRSRARY